MNRRLLIDDVCLWCARAFAGLSAIGYAYVGSFAISLGRWPRWSVLDSVRVIEIVSMIALSILWLVCLWSLLNKTSRVFLGCSVPLYLILVVWSIIRGSAFFDLTEAIFTLMALLGGLSMLWVAARPTISRVRVA